MPRYFRRGVSKLRFLPAVANKAAPTRVEITAGTDLSAQTAEIDGWLFENNPIPTPDLNTTFNTQIGGEDTAGASSITFYDDDGATNAIRTAQPKNTKGFLLFMPYGDVVTKRAETWPVTVTSISDIWTLANEPARYRIQYAVTDIPAQNAVIPA